MRSTGLVLTLACVSALLAGCNGAGSAPATVATPFRYTAAAGAFYRDYTGPQRPAIDVIAADGVFAGTTQQIVLAAKMAGPVTAGAPNYYVWGFDRGGATNAPFPDEPNVKFNAVALVTANADGSLTATVNLLNGAPAQAVTAILIAPDTLQLFIPVSQLPSTGLSADQYLWNLWPRSGVGGSAAAQISKFIPDNAMATLAR